MINNTFFKTHNIKSKAIKKNTFLKHLTNINYGKKQKILYYYYY